MGIIPTHYSVLIRRRNNDCIIDNKNLIKDFVKIKNPFLHWAADPFIFELNGEDYIYAEICNRITNKGYISFCKIDKNGKISKWKKCFSEKFHLSFPYVFKCGETIYMIPETSSSSSVILYKCISFPDVWKKERNLLINVYATDNMVVFFKSKKFLLSYNDIEHFLSASEMFDLEIGNIDCIRKEDTNRRLRPAGCCFEKDGQIYLPTQRCDIAYGYGICINRIFYDKKTINFDIEQELSSKEVSEILKKKNIVGFHTYNFNSRYEVIDICSKNLNFFSIVGKAVSLFKKVFCFKKKKQ